MLRLELTNFWSHNLDKFEKLKKKKRNVRRTGLQKFSNSVSRNSDSFLSKRLQTKISKLLTHLVSLFTISPFYYTFLFCLNLRINYLDLRRNSHKMKFCDSFLFRWKCYFTSCKNFSWKISCRQFISIHSSSKEKRVHLPWPCVFNAGCRQTYCLNGGRTQGILQGGSNMTGTDVARFTHKQSRSYLNHLVHETWASSMSSWLCC